jgi:putative aldouronate transport system substrate-binding protein
MKRLISRATAVLLLLSMIGFLFAGCAKQETTATTVKSEASTEATTAASTKAVAKEPVTLKIYTGQTFPGQFTSGVQDDPVSKAITAATGVSLDWDMAPTQDKTNVIVASGDLPDIFVLNDVNNLEALVKAGKVLDLGALLESNGADIKNLASKAVEFSKTNFSAGTDKLYYIPGRVTLGDSSSVFFSPVIGYFMRWDYYKEIGSPVLKTSDDIVAALSAMQKKHPTTADGKPTYGFSMWQDWGKWHYTVLSEVVNSVSGVPGTDAVNFIDYNNDYAFVDGLNDAISPLWVDGELYNKAYRAGLLDPDSLTQGYAQASAKMDAGQVLCQVAQWLTDGSNSALATSVGPEAGYVSIPVQGAHYGAANYNPVGLASYWCISANCKNPDRAMDVINYMFTEEASRNMLCGVKDDTWTVDGSGKAVLTDKGISLKSDPDFMIKTGARKFQNLTGIDVQSADSKGQFIDLFNDPDVLAKTLTPLKKSWLSAYGASSENEFWHKQGAIASNTAFKTLIPVAPEDIARINAKINSYLQENLAKLVMAKSDAEFAKVKQQIIDDISSMDGYKEYVAWAKSAVDTAKKGVANFK